MSETLVIINNTDISKYIINDTYKMDSEPVYEAWKDGNFREHRIYARRQVKGSFDVIFFGEDDTPYTNFLSLLSSATVNNVLTLGAYVVNDGTFQAMEAYCELSGVQHAETTDGRRVNKMTVTIEER